MDISSWSHIETSTIVSSSSVTDVVPITTSSTATTAVSLIEQTKTSLLQYYNSSSNSRKRRKSKSLKLYDSTSNNSNNNNNTNSTDVVSTLLSLRENRIPIVAITSQHQITVIVEDNDTASNTNTTSGTAYLVNDTNENDNLIKSTSPTTMIHESPILQYHSRVRNHHHHNHHSDTTSYLPTSVQQLQEELSSTQQQQQQIPAVYDSQTHRMYATQNNNTKLICYYNSNDIGNSSTGSHTAAVNFELQQQQSFCEITLSSPIISLSVLHLPTISSQISSTSSTSGCSIVYGTCTNQQIYVAITAPITTTTTTTINSPSTSQQEQRKVTFAVHYFETPLTTKACSSNGSSMVNKGPPTIPQHVGIVASLVSSNISSSLNSSSRKRRSMDDNNTMNDTIQNSSYIYCFYQIFYRSHEVLLIRQHIQFIVQPPSTTTDGSSTISCSSTILLTSSSSYNDKNKNITNHNNVQLHYPNITSTFPITIPKSSSVQQQMVDNMKVLGIVPSTGNASNIDGCRIVLSYRSCCRSNQSTKKDAIMNGSMTIATATSDTQYEYFYTMISTATKSNESISGIQTFPLILPNRNDEITHTCLMSPTMIGAITKNSQLLCLYDIYRGGLVHIDRPFGEIDNRTSSTDLQPPVVVTALLADISRSKIILVYYKSTTNNTNRLQNCIAYASTGRHNSNQKVRINVNPKPLSLADSLAASVSTATAGAEFSVMNRPYQIQQATYKRTRTLFPTNDDVLQQNELPQLAYHDAIRKAAQVLDETYRQIFESTNESNKAGFLLNRFDEAMLCITHALSTQKSNPISVGDRKATEHVVENGKKMKTIHNGSAQLVNGKIGNGKHGSSIPTDSITNGAHEKNGFHKKSAVKSPTSLKDQLYNGEENNHLTMSTNNVVSPKQKIYQLSEIPQVLIDIATSVVVSVLGMNPLSSSSTHSIRNDARILLRRLVRTGKLSARSQLNFIPVARKEMALDASSFMNLLKCLDLSSAERGNGAIWSAYTPFDLICDMLQYCSDVSEQQLVIAIKFTLFQARSVEIASYFVRNKHLNDSTSIRKQGSSLLSLVNHGQSKDVQKIIQHQKMIISGAAYLVIQIANYSKGFNSALLRNAFESEFSRLEIYMLLRLVIETISNPDKHNVPISTDTSMKNLIHFIIALCDCVHKSDMDFFDDENVDSDLEVRRTLLTSTERLLKALNTSTGRLLSLQKLIQQSKDSIKELAVRQPKQIEFNQQQVVNIERPKASSAALPPYQIERLLL